MSALIEFKPTRRQETFIQIPFEVKEALYGGAAAGGKTELLIWLPIIYNFINHPEFKGLYLRRTFPELDMEVVPRMERIYGASGAIHNKSSKTFVWPSGARMRYGHVEYDKDVKIYDSAQFNLIVFDEATTFSEYIYRYLAFSRCRSSTPDLPAIVRSGSNPDGISHTFFRKRFVDPDPNGDRLIRDKATGMYRMFIKARVTDNPHALAANPALMQQMMLLPEKERKAKLEGDWYAYSGQFFTDFRDMQMPDEPENALHWIEPFEIPDYWPRLVSVDWGYSALAVAYLGAISPDNRLYVYKELSWRKTLIRIWAKELGDAISRDNNSLPYIGRVLDPSAWQNRGDDKNIAQQIIEGSGIRFDKASNDRIAGANMVREMLRFTPIPNAHDLHAVPDHELAMRILRVKGLKDYHAYMDQFLPKEQETNIPKVQIFNTCELLREVIRSCVHDEKNPEDVQEFDGDDPYDSFRYLCMAYREITLTKRIMEERATREAALKKASDGNMTGFYRTMEKLESKARRDSAPVIRGRRFRVH